MLRALRVAELGHAQVAGHYIHAWETRRQEDMVERRAMSEIAGIGSLCMHGQSTTRRRRKEEARAQEVPAER
jgi:hypothetical protein